MADDNPPVTTTVDTTTTLTEPVTTPAYPVPPAVPAPPTSSTPAPLPVPGTQVQSLILKHVRTQIVLYRNKTWRLQSLLGLRHSPGGNIWHLGSPQAGKKTLQKWQSRSKQLRLAAKQRIQQDRRAVEYMLQVMGRRPPTRTLAYTGNLAVQLGQMNRLKYNTSRQFRNPPQMSSFSCIHRYEGSWTDEDSGHNGHYGGVQFGKKEWLTYGYPYTGKLWAYQATSTEQYWAAYRYWLVSGFNPWPQTARNCGLL